MSHLLYIQISFKSLCVCIPTPCPVSFKYSLKVFFSQGVLLNLLNFFPQKANKTLRLIHRKKRLGPSSSNTRYLKRMRVPAQPLFQISTQEEGPHHPGAVPNQRPANHQPGAVPSQGPARHLSQGPVTQGPVTQGPATQGPATRLDQL